MNLGHVGRQLLRYILHRSVAVRERLFEQVQVGTFIRNRRRETRSM